MKECQDNYGYKVCYREKGSKKFVRHLVTNTYDLALWNMERYLKSEVRSRKDNHILKNPIWILLPLKRFEAFVAWRGCPF